jgi:hypothetical protein
MCFQTVCCNVRNVGISQTFLSLDENFRLKTTAGATELKSLLNESPTWPGGCFRCAQAARGWARVRAATVCFNVDGDLRWSNSAQKRWFRLIRALPGPSPSSPQKRPQRDSGGVEVWLYSFFNLGARWGGWSTPRPCRFTPGKVTRYPLHTKLGGPQCRSGRVRKISPPPGFDPRTVQPVASRYTDYAIPAHILVPVGINFLWQYI